MTTKLIRLATITLALALSVLGGPASAQNGNSPTSGPTRTDSRILYHNGPVLLGTQFIYPIFYGDWSTRVYEQIILLDFMSTLGSTAYFRINSGYPDSSGQAPSGNLSYGGGPIDANSHSPTRTGADV